MTQALAIANTASYVPSGDLLEVVAASHVILPSQQARTENQSPELRLLHAILADALNIVSREDRREARRKKREAAAGLPRYADRQSASIYYQATKEWFADDSTLPMSFRFIADALGINDIHGFRRRLADGNITTELEIKPNAVAVVNSQHRPMGSRQPRRRHRSTSTASRSYLTIHR